MPVRLDLLSNAKSPMVVTGRPVMEAGKWADHRTIGPGSGAATLPNSYRGVPVVPIEMPMAGFLSSVESRSFVAPQYPHGIRDPQEVIIGGISGAHTNLSGQSGTIGYFCTRKSKLPRRKEVHLLSNRHVFADLRKAKVDDADLIVQPSPGEPASNRPIGTLVSFSALKFDNDLNEPNHVDAAIAKLWAPLTHKSLIPHERQQECIAMFIAVTCRNSDNIVRAEGVNDCDDWFDGNGGSLIGNLLR